MPQTRKLFDAHQFIESELHKVLAYETETPKRFDLRGSSLPFCSIYMLHDILKNPVRKEDYAFKHYTTIGTAMHEKLLQHVWPRVTNLKGVPVGLWVCDRCEKPSSSDIGPAPDGLRCSHRGCAGDLIYAEIAFQWRNASGHLDMLLRMEDGTHMALEFKTTSARTLEMADKWLPQKKHTVQIETYCLFLWLLYKIRVRAYAIIYFERDRPTKVEKVTDYGDGWSTTKRNSYSHKRREPKQIYYDSADNADESTDRIRTEVEKRYHICTKDIDQKLLQFHADHMVKADKSFDVAKSLLSHAQGSILLPKKRLQSNLLVLQKNRPCCSKQDYKDYMSKYFFGNDKCPHVDACSRKMADDEMSKPILDIYGMLTKIRD